MTLKRLIIQLREDRQYVLTIFYKDYKKIAKYPETKILSLLQDEGIIRNKLKVRATVTNAIAYMEIQKEFGSFSSYIWEFVNNEPIKNKVVNYKDAPANTPISDAISKDLKKKETELMEQLSIAKRTKLYGHLLNNAHSMIMPIEN